MREAIERVLRMLQDGRITPEEAELLIGAIRTHKAEGTVEVRAEAGWETAETQAPRLALAACWVSLEPGPGLRWRVRGTARFRGGTLSVSGGKGQVQVPKLPLEAEIAASRVDGDLGGAPLRGRVNGSKVELAGVGSLELEVVGSDAQLRLSPEAREVRLLAKASKVELLVPEGLTVAIKSRGEVVNADESVLGPSGIPVEIEAEGSLVSVRRP